jgi:hypothetical protein
MLHILNNNSPLINTLIVYLFIMYLLFMNNNHNIKNEIYIILPTIIYSLFVFLKINNK